MSFDAGRMSGISADWWVVAYAPYGWSYYVHPGMWFFAPSPESFRPAAQGPLFSFSLIEVLNITGLHAGTYVVYFGVDTNANGVIDFDQLILDSTTIDIVPQV
ncbi:MAG: hypothetical protein MZU91_05295 [Desulfosudis oleivorans]|nr:hypothetical protein [Desulfosudis oleivorans]